MDAKHAPGPGKQALADLLAALSRIADGQEMSGAFTHAETVLRYQEIARAAIAKADARLIAAAPDLLAACKAAEWNSLDLPLGVREMLVAAIAKAEGEA